MKRKITKNRHQYKVSIPIELIRRLGWDENTEIHFDEVQTKAGKGVVMLKEKLEVGI
ncbi:MAG TPA: hypothetical protein HA362_07730 [Nanoarchaeota archaeon]|nr:hypothetical protein [Nanoarchaeota archaeon]